MYTQNYWIYKWATEYSWGDIPDSNSSNNSTVFEFIDKNGNKHTTQDFQIYQYNAQYGTDYANANRRLWRQLGNNIYSRTQSGYSTYVQAIAGSSDKPENIYDYWLDSDEESINCSISGNVINKKNINTLERILIITLHNTSNEPITVKEIGLTKHYVQSTSNSDSVPNVRWFLFFRKVITPVTIAAGEKETIILQLTETI